MPWRIRYPGTTWKRFKCSSGHGNDIKNVKVSVNEEGDGFVIL